MTTVHSQESRLHSLNTPQLVEVRAKLVTVRTKLKVDYRKIKEEIKVVEADLLEAEYMMCGVAEEVAKRQIMSETMKTGGGAEHGLPSHFSPPARQSSSSRTETPSFPTTDYSGGSNITNFTHTPNTILSQIISSVTPHSPAESSGIYNHVSKFSSPSATSHFVSAQDGSSMSTATMNTTSNSDRTGSSNLSNGRVGKELSMAAMGETPLSDAMGHQ